MNVSQKYWVKHPQRVYSLGEIESVEEGNDKSTKLNVRLDSEMNEMIAVNQEDVVPVDVGSLEGIDDLLKLSLLDEANFLMNLSTRYNKQEIYTSIGSSIMISINPFRNLLQYDIRNYEGLLAMGEEQDYLPKHLFAFAREALQNIERFQKNQSVIISGESGSGKTEAMKILLGYFSNHDTQLQQQQAKQNSSLNREKRNVQQQIVDNNFILESFGNAKTARNNNSSRFGKFIKVYIREEDQQISNAVVQSYLLEKSRVTHAAKSERNYHVFYQMIRGGSADFKRKYLLGEVNEYALLRNGDNNVQIDDERNFAQLLRCFEVMKFAQYDIDAIFRIVSGILQLGNIVIEENPQTNHEAIIQRNDRYLLQAVELLQLNNAETLISAICTPSILDPSSKTLIQRQQTVVQARNSIEGLCKALYGKVFDWILEEINEVLNDENLAIQDENGNLVKQAANPRNKNFGILDIFGFEIFELNSFEQLCINYANEKIQLAFCDSVLNQEQLEYQLDGIQWDLIAFTNNQGTIDLFEGKGVSVFGLLEDECKRVDGSDDRFVNQVNSNLKKNASLGQVKQNVVNVRVLFKIKHYAGDVEYDSRGFIEKNRDSMSAELVSLVGSSGNSILSEKFAQVDSAGGNTSNAKKSVALSNQFRSQLSLLLAELRTSTNFYVKCIKPNRLSVPNSLDLAETQRQIQCAGLLEVVKVRKVGYGVRMKQEDFARRYSCLLDKFEVDSLQRDREKCERILRKIERVIEFEQIPFVVGKTKVFLKEEFRNVLENRLLSVWSSSVTIIASYQRMRVQRNFFLFVQRKAKVIQREWRKQLAQKREVERRRREEEEMRRRMEEEENERKRIAGLEEEARQRRLFASQQQQQLSSSSMQQYEYQQQQYDDDRLTRYSTAPIGNDDEDYERMNQKRQQILQECFAQADMIQRESELSIHQNNFDKSQMSFGNASSRLRASQQTPLVPPSRSSFLNTIEDTIRVKGNTLFESRSPVGVDTDVGAHAHLGDFGESSTHTKQNGVSFMSRNDQFVRGGANGGVQATVVVGNGFSMINDRSEILPSGILNAPRDAEILEILRQKSMVFVNPVLPSISMYEYLKKSQTVNEFLLLVQKHIESYLGSIQALSSELQEKKQTFSEIEYSMQGRLDNAIFSNAEFAERSRVQIEELTSENLELQTKLTNTMNELTIKQNEFANQQNEINRQRLQSELKTINEASIEPLKEQLEIEQTRVKALRTLTDQQMVEISQRDQRIIQLEAKLLKKSKEVSKLRQKDRFSEESIGFLRKNIEDQNEELKIFRGVFKQNLHLLPDQQVFDRLQQKNEESQRALLILTQKYIRSQQKENASEQFPHEMTSQLQQQQEE